MRSRSLKRARGGRWQLARLRGGQKRWPARMRESRSRWPMPLVRQRSLRWCLGSCRVRPLRACFRRRRRCSRQRRGRSPRRYLEDDRHWDRLRRRCREDDRHWGRLRRGCHEDVRQWGRSRWWRPVDVPQRGRSLAMRCERRRACRWKRRQAKAPVARAAHTERHWARQSPRRRFRLQHSPAIQALRSPERARCR